MTAARRSGMPRAMLDVVSVGLVFLEDLFAVAERARGEPRALLFEYTDTAGPAADPYAADEDARHRRPW